MTFVDVNDIDDEIDYKKEFKRLLISLIKSYILIFKKYSFVILDFLFQRYKWYRNKRRAFSVKIMPICYGDARNHVKSRWKIFTNVDDNIDMVRLFKNKYEKRYFILEAWMGKNEVDIVKYFKVKPSMLKKYKRFEKINNLLDE